MMLDKALGVSIPGSGMAGGLGAAVFRKQAVIPGKALTPLCAERTGNAGYSQPYGPFDILMGSCNLSRKPIAGKFKHEVFEGEKYRTRKGMARSGDR